MFLAARPGSGAVGGRPSRVYVLIQGSLAGDIDVLKTIPVGSIKSIQRVQAMAAYTQFGDVQAGDSVLLVRLR